MYAESTVPLTENPATMLDERDVRALPFRVHDGDDASCLNLNRAQTPRLLGANVEELSSSGAFVPEGTDEGLWNLLDLDLANKEAQLNDLMCRLPNLPMEGIKISDNPADNVIVKTVGEKPHFSFPFKNHLELSDRHKLFDFARGAKISGSG